MFIPKEDDMLKMNLQLFASNGEDEDEEVEEVETEEETEIETEKVDLLEFLEKDEEMKKQFQATVDRRITQALETRDKKHQEELRRQEQRANMTAEELQAEKERELSEREQKIRDYELKLSKIEFFKEEGLPLELVDYVNVNSEEEIEEKSKALVDIINAQVEREVKDRLKQNGYDSQELDNDSVKLSIEELEGMTTEQINANWNKLTK